MKGISLMALAILVLIVALITEIIVLKWGLIESNLLFRSLRERAILSSINKFGFAKRFQTQALTFSFYKTYEVLGERGGYYQFPGNLKSRACIPYWKIYDEKFVPNIKKEMGDVAVKIFNKYMQSKIDENLQFPSYEKIEVAGGEIKERKWCEKKTCSADWGTSCTVGGICIEKGEEPPTCTYTACWWGRCVGACFPYLGVCSETRLCKATCEENLGKCPSTITNLQATAITSDNLVFEREKIKIEESGTFSQNITAGLLYEHYFGNQIFVEKEKIREAVKDAINDAIHTYGLKFEGSYKKCEECPTPEEVFSHVNKKSVAEVEELIKLEIKEKLKNLGNKLSIPGKIEVNIQPIEASKVIIECKKCEIDGPCCYGCLYYIRECTFSYFGAVDALVAIENKENKFLIGNELKLTPLKFRIIEEYGTTGRDIHLIPYPSTENCPPPI